MPNKLAKTSYSDLLASPTRQTIFDPLRDRRTPSFGPEPLAPAKHKPGPNSEFIFPSRKQPPELNGTVFPYGEWWRNSPSKDAANVNGWIEHLMVARATDAAGVTTGEFKDLLERARGAARSADESAAYALDLKRDTARQDELERIAFKRRAAAYFAAQDDAALTKETQEMNKKREK